MQCHNWIDPTKVSRRGKLLKSAVLGTWEAKFSALSNPNARRCYGNIVATVKVEDEPTYGDHYGVLRIEYQCERCKELIYRPGLPREEEEIAAILTQYVSSLPTKPTEG